MTVERDVLKVHDIAGLRKLSSRDFTDCSLTEEEITHIFKLCDALWLHSGNPADPHAELTSGKCSNGFVDVLRALRYTNICEIMATMLVRKLEDEYEYYEKHHGWIDWVIGSDHAGAAFSHSVATRLSAQHDFTEKGPEKTQIWKRFTIAPDEVVLQVEELVTTAGTLEAVRAGLRRGNSYPVKFAQVVMTLVHRSQLTHFEGAEILYLVHYDIDVWDPTECPLCKAGSPRYRPKTHWKELT